MARFFLLPETASLITRTKDIYDNAIPSGNSVAVHALFKLALLTGEERYRRPAEATWPLSHRLHKRRQAALENCLRPDFFLSSCLRLPRRRAGRLRSSGWMSF
jgi:uncharacterized protein YyaL (SSP411 family)